MPNYELYFCFSAVFVNAAHFQTSGNTSPSGKDFITTNPKTVTNAERPAETTLYCSSKAPKPTAKVTRKTSTEAAKKIAANVRYGRNAAERSPGSRNWMTASTSRCTMRCTKNCVAIPITHVSLPSGGVRA